MKRILFQIFCMLSLAVQAQKSPVYGRTTGLLPFLEFGLGEDRLGGAKMTYLDSNILVQVIDSTKDDYKVRLSAYHHAYLPKVNFKADTSIAQPYYLSNSCKVWGDAKYDYVTINLPERLPYKSQQQIHPSRLIVDLYGVTSNTNWITQLKSAKEIGNIWPEQLENDVLRLHIELQHRQHWGYFIYYVGNQLHIRVKQQPANLKRKGMLVAIDAGHGGANEGAKGWTSGVLEKDYTLKMSKQLEKLLKQKGMNVYMTRQHDTDLNMIERTLMLRAADPDLLISIHLNSAGRDSVKGTSTYYRYIGFRPLSQAILDRMLELKLDNFGNVGSFNFALSGPTEYPNCLVEVAFLSNPADEKRILSPKFHKDVAEQIYKGIRDWVKAVE